MKGHFALTSALVLLSIAGFGQVKRVVVAADGSGDYRTVQSALDAVPLHNERRIEIFIKNGLYREKLHLDSTKDKIMLTGEDRFNTVLSYDDHPGMVNPQGDSIN